MSIQIAKTRQKMILKNLDSLKRQVALHPNPLKRMVIFQRIDEIEKLLK